MRSIPQHWRAGLAAVPAAVATLLAFPAIALGASNLSDASGLTATAGASGLSNGGGDVATIVGALIDSTLGLLGVLFVVLIIYAGFLWMTAQGNDEKVKQAKKILSGAVIGMVLIFSAYAITTFVISALRTSLDAQTGAEPDVGF